MQRALEVVAAALERDPQQALRALDVLPASERTQVLEGWNATARDYPAGRCLHELIEAQADRTPQAVAVRQDGASLTYAELNARANRLAHHLRTLGVGPDARVAVCLGRSVELVVALVAVLKAGGAYVPLDPGYPGERLAYMLGDSAPAVVLADAVGREALDGAGLAGRIVIDPGADAAAWAAAPADNLSPQEIGLDARHLAYVIYTSGSTGQPKGAMNEHRGIVNRLVWMQEEYGLTADDAVLQKTPFSFDVSVWEFFWPLMTGASIVVARPDGHRDPAYLRREICASGVTTLHFVPSMLQLFLESEGVGECAAVVRRVMCSGEALPASLVRRFHERLPGVELHNLYGPTEAAVDVTYWACEPGAEGQGIPIGRPVANTRIYILDESLRPAPVGVAGELFIAGVQVGRGYLNREELTAERFVSDPYDPDPAARMYKTGDLARWTAEGVIEYLGRNDFQVKIRGLRIELGEVEASLAGCPGVQDVVVLAREDQAGDKRLVAYYVGEADIEALRGHASESLPQYMVPAAFVRLESMPVTPNGKLDRAALPAPEGGAVLHRGYAAPQGPIEEVLARLWAEQLGLERVGRNDNYFELGGHSLMAVSLIERMRMEGLHADVRALFAAPTLADLAQAVGSVSREVAVPPNLIPADGSAVRITPEMVTLAEPTQEELDALAAQVPGGVGNIQDIYPLAPLQEGILFHHLLAEEGDPYLLRSLYSFATRERLDSVLEALQRVIDRHDILRTGIYWEGLAQPLQVVLRDARLPVEWIALDPADGDLEQQLEARFDPQHACIDLAEAPLLRCHVVEDAAAGRFLLHVLAHHLIIDHTTVDLLLDEAQAIEAGQEAALPEPVPFRNFVAQARLGVSREEHEAFFRGMLGDVDEPTAPFGLMDVQGQGDIAEARLVLDDALADSLRRRTRALGVSLASLMHLAWALVLARTTGRRDVVFGTVLFGRLQAGAHAERMLGMFINTLPVRIRVTTQGVEHCLRQTHGLLAQLLRHEHAPLALAQRCSGVDAQMPLFTSLLNFRHTPIEAATGGDDAAGQEGSAPAGRDDVEELGASERSNYPFGICVDDLGLAIVLTAQVRGSIAPQRICALLETALRELAHALQEAPLAPLAGLDVLPAQEREQGLSGWDGTAQPEPEQHFLHELFEAQVARDPERIALAWRDGRMSYGQLNERANRLAHYLRNNGVEPESRVAICAERGPALVGALLAVLKAGGAYVPLDPAYPPERLAYMIEDCEPHAILTCGGPAREALARAGVSAERLFDLDADAWRWAPASTDNLPRRVVGLTPRHLAYVIYTSGSTGQPKGVMNEHRGLSNLVAAQMSAFGIDSTSRVLQFASPSFDASVSEIGTALGSGASLCLASSDDLMPGRTLLQILRHLDVTHVTLPPSALPLLAAERMPFAPSTLIVAGEAVSPKDANAWSGALRLINAYGPTETTVCATTHVCAPDPGATIVPIGRPIANMRVYLLDADQQPVPAGAVGEICIGGVGVARGYLNKPALTSECFLPDPFAAQRDGSGGDRMYRTGDLGRWRGDGTIEYLGRSDFQVKIRGFRIEPGEIEARLAAHPAVREVRVVVRESASGDATDKRLVAYYVGTASVEEVRALATASLPRHMLPAAYVCMERLPLTPNGKLDRKALPVPEGEAFGRRAYEAPQGEVEVELAAIWTAVLGVEQVGRHDNFFQIGGHSLLAVQLIAHVRKRFEIELPLSELFLRPTLTELAASIEAGRMAALGASLLIPLRTGGSAIPLFFIHALEGNVGYAADLARWVNPDVPVFGLVASGLNKGEEPLRSVEAMAARYIDEMLRVQPQGPYRIASWSAGGQVAYEIAHQLAARGETVGFVGLIDTMFRVTALSDEMRKWHGRERAGQAPREERERAMLLVNLQHVLNVPPKRVKELAQLGSVPEILAAMVGGGDDDLFEIETYERHNAMQCAFVEAIDDYDPPAATVPVVLFAASKSQRKDASLGWRPLVGERLRVVSIKGDHQSILQEPRIAELGAALSLALQRHGETEPALTAGEPA
ncbi:amino acid adenylation domain-containing protein [Thauera sinica]|uniref:Amino acid adenylation domain-containing protein n=5 Tax=Thauera TaxID=33057 RepID=A0ABW1AU71_9RHOO